jgi:hypothetical protein
LVKVARYKPIQVVMAAEVQAAAVALPKGLLVAASLEF